MEDSFGCRDDGSDSIEVVGFVAAPTVVVPDTQVGWGGEVPSPAASSSVPFAEVGWGREDASARPSVFSPDSPGDWCGDWGVPSVFGHCALPAGPFAPLASCNSASGVIDIPDTQACSPTSGVLMVGGGVSGVEAPMRRGKGGRSTKPASKLKAKRKCKAKAKTFSCAGRIWCGDAPEVESGADSRSPAIESPTLIGPARVAPRPRKRGRPSISKEQLQGRLRSKNFRVRAALEKQARDGDGRDLLPRLVGEPYRTGQYTMENVAWIAKLGTCPSAGGARAPLAGVISHVACAVSRFTVELHRSRMHRYMLRAEGAIWRDFIRDRAVGVVLKFDETPMRLCTDGLLFQSTAILVRCIKGFDVTGNILKRCPDLRRPGSVDAPGIFSCVGLEDLGIAVSFASGSRWRFVVISSDGAAVNKLVAKMVVWKLRRQKHTLVLHSLCYKHHLSNAARWSISSVPYGLHLRLCHFLQTRPIKDATLHCARMIGDEPYVEDFIAEAEAQTVWPLLLQYLVRPADSLSAVVDQARLGDISVVACKLFPSLPPSLGSSWCGGTGSVAEFNLFLVKVFGKCAPVPIISRWFTMERFCWHVLGLRMLSLLDFLLPADAFVHFWPGDDALAAADGAERYHARSSQRMQKLRDYMGSDRFASDLLITCISSIPRWHMARALDSAVTGGAVAADLTGVRRAMERLLDDTLRILEGKDPLVEYLLRREGGEECMIRMRACRSLATTVLYLGEKNRPNCAHIWRVVRGEISVDDMLTAGCAECCADDGATAKIFSGLVGLSDGARAASVALLKEAVRACSAVLTAPGGEDNLECESHFSKARFLGLKTPFRPPKLTTLRREIGNQYFVAGQRSWVKHTLETVYGGLDNARLLLANQKNVAFNGFTAFVRHLGRVVTECDSVWQRLSAATKARWADVARQLNSENASMRGEALPTPPPESSTGPLGSRDARCPVDVEALHAAVNGEDPDLARLWKKSEIRAWNSSLDETTPSSAWPTETMREVRNIKLPGQPCMACEEAERAERPPFASLRSAIIDCYDARGGLECGLTVGLITPGESVWLEIPCISRRPVKLFAYPLDLVRTQDVVIADLGIVASAPSVARPMLGASFTAASMCLIDICVRLQLSPPSHFVVLLKSGMVCDLDGWEFQYASTHHVERVKPSKAATAPKTSRRASTVAGAGSVYDDVFGGGLGCAAPSSILFPEDADDCDMDIEGIAAACDVSSGEEDSDMEFHGVTANSLSEDELVAKLLVAEDDRVDITARAREVVDCDKYAVFVSSSTGTVTAFWRVSEKNRHRASYKAAVRKLATVPDARKLRASKSALLSLHGVEGCLHRCTVWSQWHAAWVYRKAPRLILPLSMPLPRGMVTEILGAVGETIAPQDGSRDALRSDHPKAPAAVNSPMRLADSEDDVSSATSSVSGCEPDADDIDTSSMSSTSVGSMSY